MENEGTPRQERSRRWLLVRHPLAVAAGVMGLAALFLGLWVIREVLLLGFFAVLIAVAFSFPVGWLSRWIPRGVAVVLVLLGVLGAAFTLAAITVPALAREGQQMIHNVPEALQHARTLVQHAAEKSQMGPGAKAVTQKVQTQATDALSEAAKHLVPAAVGVVEGLTTAILLLVLAAFLSLSPNVYRDAVRTLVPRQWEPEFDETWKRMALGLRHWVGGIIVSMFLMGAFTAVGLLIAGISGWYLLAILTFLGTFVPYLGAILSAVPGLIAGLAQSPVKMLAAAGVYLGVHLVEGYIVQPLVMKRAVEIRPATLLFGQVAAGALFGVMGIVVATPLIVCLKASVGYLYIERRLAKPPPRT